MRQKTIEKNLTRVLLKNMPFEQALFEYELEENIKEYLISKHADGDIYFIAITEHTNDVAMLLIDENDKVHINEDARTVLKKLWEKNYQKNLQALIPDIAGQLDNGYIYTLGVKVVDSSAKRVWRKEKKTKA